MDDQDQDFIRIAIEEARLDPRPHKVGAVVVLHGKELGRGHGDRDHAEAALLDRLEVDLRGATIYTTLEPCTRRGHPDKHCALLIKERGITRVVIGVRDPNPNITNSARLFFMRQEMGRIAVDYAPAEFRKEIELLMGEWFSTQGARMSYSKLFADVTVNPEIAGYSGPSVGTSQTLRLCPDVQQGWLMGETRLHHDRTKFQLPAELAESYKQYFTQHYEEKGFERDNVRLMLTDVPLSLSDTTRKLSLKTKESSFSYAQFCKDVIASDQARRISFIAEINRTEQIRVPHTFALHMIVVTDDNKVLITKRGPNLHWAPNTWSCSIEEQASVDDLGGGVDGTMLKWGKRTLLEELGASDCAYSDENLRLISVFLESDVLNVSLCGHVVLNISSNQLSDTIKRKPRKDKEFTAWEYLPCDEDALMSEILKPRLGYEYHPTSGYRLLMTLVKRNGLPVDSERFFVA